jgi:hypothetical protein
LNALKPDSDENRDGWVSLKEIFDCAVPIVEKLRLKQVGPQTPQMVSPQVLSNMPVMRSGLSESGAKVN